MKKTMCLAVLFIAQGVAAQAEVIADFGGRDSGYRNPSALMQDAAKRLPAAALKAPLRPQMQRFPLRSNLRVGLVHSRMHKLPMDTPIFIAGVDADSLRWIEANHDYLHSIGARGIVTNVDTLNDVLSVQQMFSSLRIVTVPVTHIANAFALEHYPVLITRQEIRQ